MIITAFYYFLAAYPPLHPYTPTYRRVSHVHYYMTVQVMWMRISDSILSCTTCTSSATWMSCTIISCLRNKVMEASLIQDINCVAKIA